MKAFTCRFRSLVIKLTLRAVSLDSLPFWSSDAVRGHRSCELSNARLVGPREKACSQTLSVCPSLRLPAQVHSSLALGPIRGSREMPIPHTEIIRIFMKEYGEIGVGWIMNGIHCSELLKRHFHFLIYLLSP